MEFPFFFQAGPLPSTKNASIPRPDHSLQMLLRLLPGHNRRRSHRHSGHHCCSRLVMARSNRKIRPLHNRAHGIRATFTSIGFGLGGRFRNDRSASRFCRHLSTAVPPNFSYGGRYSRLIGFRITGRLGYHNNIRGRNGRTVYHTRDGDDQDHHFLMHLMRVRFIANLVFPNHVERLSFFERRGSWYAQS